MSIKKKINKKVFKAYRAGGAGAARTGTFKKEMTKHAKFVGKAFKKEKKLGGKVRTAAAGARLAGHMTAGAAKYKMTSARKAALKKAQQIAARARKRG